MTKYDEKSKCSKCGSGLISTQYDGNRDELKRTCQRCEYFWYEKSLNAKPRE